MEYRTYQTLNTIGGMKARYFIIGVAVLFFLIQIVGHDTNILYNYEHGYIDYNQLANLYIKFANHAQAYLVGTAIVYSMAAMIVWSITIVISRTLAQRATVALPDDEPAKTATRYEELSKEDSD